MRADSNPQFFSGDRWRLTHRASVVSILGAEAPEVLSRGSRFYNVDRWTMRVFVKHMCDWAKANPGVAATRVEVAQWVGLANAEQVPKRHIVIAATPPKLSIRVALALVGGGYHEAFHTRYSCRRTLSTPEMCNIVLPRWAQVADWSKLYGLLQEWNNIVEDIRIERRGNEDYPGCLQKMGELQDFILAQERATREGKSESDSADTLYVVTAMFRDLGLGYVTSDQDAALALYRARNPAACDVVEHGPLAPHLDDAIALSSTDDLGCLRVAMDVLVELTKLVDPKDVERASQECAGNGGKPKCPKCGAPGKDLVVRPLSNGKGGKVKGRGVITCTKCGWQETIDLRPSSGAGGSAPDPEDVVKFEDVPQAAGGGGKPDNDEGGAGSPGAGKGSGTGGGGEDSGGSDDGPGGGAPAGKDEGEGGGDDDDSGDGGGGAGKTDGNTDSDGEPGNGAGGHHWDPDRVKAWEVVAEDLLATAAKGETAGLLDMGTALEDVFAQVRAAEDKDVADDERAWRPWTTVLDVVQTVEPSDKGKADDEVRAKALLDSLRSETSYLRARLRVIVRSVEQRSTAHGVRKGRGISERMLVDSVADIRSGVAPRRAYYEVSDKIDTSLAAVVVIDQSGSMGGVKKLQDATKCLLAIAEPLDAIGSAVLVAGFRDGPYDPTLVNWDELRSGEYHRFHGICHDVFKGFDERFLAARWRFANTRAVGGTPMADGVQFGLDALSARQEAHRALFIVTDGDPNAGHEAVIRRQVRLAKKSRINVIGVGIGPESRNVMTLFPDHVWAEKIADMPKCLVEKLNELIDFRGIGRGKPLQKSS
jgi:uncharacterized protein YegL